ncbi:MAG: hypothetical protein DRO40_08780 [Thermoprotei archaeon]|nr:MAG: hypothetical protein DRO40_08780 [Thermoprotei archaeon]
MKKSILFAILIFLVLIGLLIHVYAQYVYTHDKLYGIIDSGYDRARYLLKELSNTLTIISGKLGKLYESGLDPMKFKEVYPEDYMVLYLETHHAMIIADCIKTRFLEIKFVEPGEEYDKLSTILSDLGNTLLIINHALSSNDTTVIYEYASRIRILAEIAIQLNALAETSDWRKIPVKTVDELEKLLQDLKPRGIRV